MAKKGLLARKCHHYDAKMIVLRFIFLTRPSVLGATVSIFNIASSFEYLVNKLQSPWTVEIALGGCLAKVGHFL